MLARQRLLSEFVHIKHVLLALPHAGSDWHSVLSDALNCYADIIKCLLANDQSLCVILLIKRDSTTDNWLGNLELSNSERDRLRVLTDIAYDDTWIRDYGPLSCLKAEGEHVFCTFQFNGWGQKYTADADNAVSAALSSFGISPLKEYALVLEGGALEINNKGVLLVNEDCVVDEARNPNCSQKDMELELKKKLGAKSVEWLRGIQLTGDDTDGHIDTLARFVNDDVLVCCGKNAQHHDANALDSLVSQLEIICRRQKWALHQLPMPVVRSSIDGRLLPATYANFLFCNKCLYVPVYGVEEDQQAIALLEKLLPETKIVAIRCEALLEQHGSLHCATMQIASDVGHS
ncbi:Agmatine/peptidylarginine deiminase [Alteromonadaceae bacterium Bs31]|nr:Agmatine/peptidylarginine deiminase [Alteromonadaceae bacterium Bs31]